MEIMLVGPTSPRFKGGIVHYTYNLYRELIQQHRVTLISFSRSYPQRFFPGAQVADTSKQQFRITNEQPTLDWLNPLSWIRTARLINEKKPQFVIIQWWTWFWTLPYFVILLLIKVKIILIAHNPFDHEQALYKQWSSKLVLNFADKIVVHNSQMKKNLERVYSSKKIILAYHPLYDFFRKTAARGKIKIRPFQLLFFGHVREYKGLDILLRAMNLLWQKGAKINLVVAGEFWEDKTKYLALIPVKFKHHVKIVDRYLKNEEAAAYFAAAKAVVVPYRSGTGAGPAKIALAFDKPIIATPVADNPDLFKLANVGVLLKTPTPAELTKGIETILNKPANYYQAEIAKIKKQLTWKQLVYKILA